MRIKSNSNDSIPFLLNDILSLKKTYDIVRIVDATNRKEVIINNNTVNKTNNSCLDSCPLKDDKCGCICPATLSTGERRCRFTHNKTSANFSISKIIKIYNRQYVLFMSLKISPEFSFGAYSETEAVNAITEISSNLVIDPLTSIFNRKFLTDKIEYLIKDSINTKTELCMACIDIDNFKRFNDSYGHDFGDEVLKLVSKVMLEFTNTFKEGYSIRFGGDEFIIITRQIEKNIFKANMNKMLIKVRDSKLRYKDELIGVTITIGVASVIADNCIEYKDLYKKADKMLYKAKSDGKGCVR